MNQRKVSRQLFIGQIILAKHIDKVLVSNFMYTPEDVILLYRVSKKVSGRFLVTTCKRFEQITNSCFIGRIKGDALKYVKKLQA
jgi:hypothetical protein